VPRFVYSKQLQETFKRPVFGVKDLVELGVPPGYARLRLHQLHVSGRIHRVERGKYTTSDNPVLVATHLTEPCYLALWSALSARGLTTQIPFAVQVVTSRERFARRLVFAGSELRFHHVRPGLMFGYEQVPYGDGWRVPMAKVEKVIIDAIYLGEIPLGELGEAVEAADSDLLREYSELTGNRRVISAVRGLLEC
jgi:predicted transcriptional regulator of viral defense system